MNANNFYVYLYKNPLKNGEPFYVGKGVGNRSRRHLQFARSSYSCDSNLHKLNTIRKILRNGLEPDITIVDEGISEDQAFELEMFLISEIGRADLKQGTLTNLTDGGDGVRGWVGLSGELNPMYGKPGTFTGKKHSKETCQRLSEVNLGKKHREETKEKLSKHFTGRPWTEEAKRNAVRPKDWKFHLSEAKKNSSYVQTEEHKRKVSKSLIGNTRSKGRKMGAEEIEMRSKALKGHVKPKTACSVCGKLIANHMLHRYHEENCKLLRATV